MSKEVSPRRSRFAVSSYFLIGGTAIAVWGVHIPEVERRLQITHSVIGSIILLFGFGAFLAMQAMGWVIDHYGSKAVTALGGIATGLSLFIPAYANDVPSLAGGIFVLGASVGILDVGMNANGVVVERKYQRSIFSALHAMWSFGGIVGALIGGIALSLNTSMNVTLSVTGAIMAIASAALWGSLVENKPTDLPAKHEKSAGNKANRKLLGIVLWVGFMACFAAIAEGSAVDWSALHLKTVLHASSGEAALGVGAFSAAMAITRLIGDKLVDRFGRFAVVRYGSLLASAGIATAVLATAPWVGVLGWAILGIGIAGVIPQLFIAAGNIGEESHSGRNMAKVFGLTYFGIMSGPAIIGFLTNWIPLNTALSLGCLLTLVVAAGASILRSDKIR
jgi:MFS family permease